MPEIRVQFPVGALNNAVPWSNGNDAWFTSRKRWFWPCLIRECYGSLAIRAAQLKGQRVPEALVAVPTSRMPLPDDIGSLDELESVIGEIARQEDERAKATVRELLDEQLAFTCDETTAGLSLDTVDPGRFSGQVIRDSKRIVYASLPVTSKWLADNRWQTAKPFAI